jgi:hypothetical protein
MLWAKTVEALSQIPFTTLMSNDTYDRDAWTIALVGAPAVGKTRFISRVSFMRSSRLNRLIRSSQFVLDDFEGGQPFFDARIDL